MSYATLADARAEGVTTEQADDPRLQRLLDQATRTIDDTTGWWFSPRALTMRLDGPGTPALLLPAPPIALSSVVASGFAVDLAELVVEGAPGDWPDRRGAPTLRRSAGVWCEGIGNVVVAGTFGYVEADHTSAPPPIREACLRLAVRNLARLADAEGQAERRRSDVFKESTDGHSYELLGNQPGAAGAWRRGGLTGDPDIDLVLLRYRRPPAGGRV